MIVVLADDLSGAAEMGGMAFRHGQRADVLTASAFGGIPSNLNVADLDADVLVMMQQSWPFECQLRGVTTRDEILRADGGEDEDAPLGDGCARSDVFLVEGAQLRYGSKTAWEVATR